MLLLKGHSRTLGWGGVGSRSPLASTAGAVFCVGVVVFWFPAHGHPDGPSDVAWFRVVDGLGYRAEGHPAGASTFPCFKLIDGWAYPTLGLPATTVATFQVVGFFAYAEGGGPWFRIG